jgi:hypothetical protein
MKLIKLYPIGGEAYISALIIKDFFSGKLVSESSPFCISIEKNFRDLKIGEDEKDIIRFILISEDSEYEIENLNNGKVFKPPQEGEAIVFFVNAVLKELGVESFSMDPILDISEEVIEVLREKVFFYIPVVIGLKESYLYAWKYFCGKAGIPVILINVNDEIEILKNIIHNWTVADNLSFIILEDNKEAEEIIKNAGYVPLKIDYGNFSSPLITEIALSIFPKKFLKIDKHGNGR